MEDSIDIFTETLTELMQDAHIGVRQLSEMIGCDIAAIRRWLYKMYLPTPETVIKIADAFSVSADYLFGLTDTKEFSKIQSTDTFYQRYVRLRDTQQYSDYSVAKHCKIRDSALSKWKKIQTFPATLSLLKLAKYFACSLEYLLGRSRN